MRIGIEAQRLFRPNKHGMEVVALEMLREIRRINSKHEIFLFVKKDEDICITSNENLQVVVLPHFFYPVWEQITIRRELRRYGIELLHCTANTAPLNLKTNFLITLHDIIYLENTSFKGSSYQNFGNLYRRFVVPKVVKKSNMLITVSRFEKERIVEELKVPREKVKVVYNAVNSTFRCHDQEKLAKAKEQYGLPDRFILHFANTAPKKNTIGALKAFAHLVKEGKHADLSLVVTDIAPTFIEVVLKEMKVPELKERIKILDYIPFGEIPLLYNLAYLFLYPSLRESFGMPILEGMACGTPVVTSSTSSMPEIAGGAALLADPHDPLQIAKQLHALLSNDGLYAEKRERGFIQAKKFNWHNTAEDILSTYNEFSS